ncbi:MAG TPA: hypothetical protein DD856_06355 [Sulfobacillus sp.]|nr:hypothetical protein [Sulfobacillus sp.]
MRALHLMWARSWSPHQYRRDSFQGSKGTKRRAGNVPISVKGISRVAISIVITTPFGFFMPDHLKYVMVGSSMPYQSISYDCECLKNLGMGFFMWIRLLPLCGTRGG